MICTEDWNLGVRGGKMPPNGMGKLWMFLLFWPIIRKIIVPVLALLRELLRNGYGRKVEERTEKGRTYLLLASDLSLSCSAGGRKAAARATACWCWLQQVPGGVRWGLAAKAAECLSQFFISFRPSLFHCHLPERLSSRMRLGSCRYQGSATAQHRIRENQKTILLILKKMFHRFSSQGNNFFVKKLQAFGRGKNPVSWIFPLLKAWGF